MSNKIYEIAQYKDFQTSEIYSFSVQHLYLKVLYKFADRKFKLAFF